MTQPTLYNLDPTQFALGRSTGKFRQMTRVPESLEARDDIGSIISGIPSPTLPKPEAPDLSKFELTGDDINKINAAKKAMDAAVLNVYNAWGGSSYYTRGQGSVVSEFNKGYHTSQLQKADSSWDAWGKMSYSARQEAEYKRQKAVLDKYSNITTAYNNEVSAYKKSADAYNKQVGEYKKKLEGVGNTYQANRQNAPVNLYNPEVDYQGNTLAASSLYSDNLHQMMLNSVGAANAEPASDQLTSIYSR